MSGERYSVYDYRWVVLAVFVFINITIQIMITFLHHLTSIPILPGQRSSNRVAGNDLYACLYSRSRCRYPG